MLQDHRSSREDSFFPSQAEKLAFFLVLERDLGVDHDEVMDVATSLTSAQVSY